MSRKSRKAKQRALLTAPAPIRDAAQAPIARRALDREGNITVRLNPPGVEKMSGVLLRFAEPILDRSAPIEETRAALFFAMTIWNYPLLSEKAPSKAKDMLRDVMRHPRLKSEAQRLLARKAQLFADDRRMLYDLEVFEKGGHLTVQALSLNPTQQTAGKAT